MGEQDPPPDGDQHDPTTKDEDIEGVAPLIPDVNPVPHERRDIPDEEPYQRGQPHDAPEERRPSGPDIRTRWDITRRGHRAER